MSNEQDPISRAIAMLRTHRTLRLPDRAVTAACLIRAEDWRALEAQYHAAAPAPSTAAPDPDLIRDAIEDPES